MCNYGYFYAILFNTYEKDLMNILVCPVCKGKLTLTVDKENEKEIVSGSLFCGKCNARYPIVGHDTQSFTAGKIELAGAVDHPALRGFPHLDVIKGNRRLCEFFL